MALLRISLYTHFLQVTDKSEKRQVRTVNENLWILHRFIPLNISQTAWNVTSLQEADKSRTGLCDSVIRLD